jgi:hypothetical protein
VPPDLVEQSRAYDAKRIQGEIVDLRSKLSITQQVQAIGVGVEEFRSRSSKDARLREMFLVEQGLTLRRGQSVVLMRDLLAHLRPVTQL